MPWGQYHCNSFLLVRQYNHRIITFRRKNGALITSATKAAQYEDFVQGLYVGEDSFVTMNVFVVWCDEYVCVCLN